MTVKTSWELVFKFSEKPTLSALGKFGPVIETKVARDWELREVPDHYIQTDIVAPTPETFKPAEPARAVVAAQPSAQKNNGGLKWKKWEIELVRTTNSIAEVAEVAEKLGRSRGAVNAKRIELGMTLLRHVWTKEEYDLLQENIESIDDPLAVDDLAKVLELRPEVVRTQMYNIKAGRKLSKRAGGEGGG